MADYVWEGMVDTSGGSFSFESVTTNATPVTNLWGDADQSITTIPFEQVAAIGQPAFTIAPVPAGQVLMRLTETSGVYLVNSAVFQD